MIPPLTVIMAMNWLYWVMTSRVVVIIVKRYRYSTAHYWPFVTFFTQLLQLLSWYNRLVTAKAPSSDISETQVFIMRVIDGFARSEKQPVPRHWLIKKMAELGIISDTTQLAVSQLLKKGYLRKAAMMTNKTYYFMSIP